MNSKFVLTVTAVLLVIVGALWLIVPDALYGMLGIMANSDLDFMARRYSAYILGLVVTLWLTRSAANTQARRAVMIGAFVTIALTAAASLYGALVMGLSTWLVFGGEFVLLLGFAWVLFIKPEPIV